MFAARLYDILAVEPVSDAREFPEKFVLLKSARYDCVGFCWVPPVQVPVSARSMWVAVLPVVNVYAS